MSYASTNRPDVFSSSKKVQFHGRHNKFCVENLISNQLLCLICRQQNLYRLTN